MSCSKTSTADWTSSRISSSRRLELAPVLAALKSCSCTRNLEKGRQIHADVSQSGSQTNIFVASALITMYAKCGSLFDACKVFDSIDQQDRDVVSWTALITANSENGKIDEALKLYRLMQSQGCEPNARTFVAVIKACTTLAAEEEASLVDGRLLKFDSLKKGMALHAEAAQKKCGFNVFVCNTLVDMYANCGAVELAQEIFDNAETRTVVSWNALILGYAEHDQEETALDLFAKMTPEVCPPNSRTYVAAMKACSNLAEKEDHGSRRVLKTQCLKAAMDLHSQAKRLGFDTDLYLSSILIDVYSKCGSFVDAWRVFQRIRHHRNLVTYNAMILCYADNDEEELALDLFASMERSSIASGASAPDSRTYVAALKACVGLAAKEVRIQVPEGLMKMGSLHRGMEIHSQAAKNNRLDSNRYVANMLVEIYAVCGSLIDAERVFDGIVGKNATSWISLMAGYVSCGEAMLALEVYSEFVSRSIKSMSFDDHRACGAAVKACVVLAEGESSRELSVDDGVGRKILISVKVSALEIGMKIHSHAEEKGMIISRNLFLASSLVDMYAKCGSLIDSRRVFDGISNHDTVLWTTMILRYAESGSAGDASSALELFSRMKSYEGCCSPDSGTYVAVLKACAILTDLEAGKAVHGEICRSHFETAVLATCLLDFYGRCGSLIDSQLVFDSVQSKDSVTWSTLIAAYGRQGNTSRVFGLFKSLLDEGVRPDAVTFLSLLSSCGHAGTIERAWRWFDAMSSSEFGICRGIEHYHCMIDMLGRSNRLDEALAMAESMPYEADVVTWRTVLGACQKWKNVVVGKLAFEKLQSLEKSNSSKNSSAAYSLMANINGAFSYFQL